MTSKKGYVLLDMDGTICNATHRLHFIENKPKNWKEFFKAGSLDPVYSNIEYIVREYIDFGYDIVVCTARPENNRKITENWLIDKAIPVKEILMRKDKDFRPDYIVKEEMLEGAIEKYGMKPTVAIDDKDAVLEMFKRNGVLTIDAKYENSGA